MPLLSLVRRLGVRLAGLRVGASDPSVAANYDYLATSAARALHALLRGNDGTDERTLRTDTSGRLVSIPLGDANNAFDQDASNRLVVVPYGSAGAALLQDAANRLAILLTGVDSGSTNRSLRTDTSGRLQTTIWPHSVLYEVQNCPTVLTTAYTVPASTTAVLTELLIVNNNASARTLYLVANSVSFWPTSRSIPAAAIVRVPLSRPLSAAQNIDIQASGADVAVTICGVTYA